MAESDLIRGNVDTVILKVLYEGDRYGYDLIKQINARSEGQWEIKQPTVYACLKRLEKQGFISSYWDSSESDGGRRKYYSLTESGKEVFLKYKSEFERAHALFGGIISGSGEPTVFIQPTDDYSDVEDEGYSLPKRPVKRVKKEKTDISKQPEQTEQLEQLVQTEEQVEQSEEPAQPVANDGAVILEDQPIEKEQSEPQPVIQPVQTAQRPMREALDPQAIIEQLYAAESGESYSDARRKSDFTDKPLTSPQGSQQKPSAPAPIAQSAKPAVAQTAPAPTQPAPTQPAPAPAIRQTAPIQAAQPTMPAAQTAGMPVVIDDEESPARREYKTVLEELVDRFEVAPPDIRTQRTAPAAEQAATGAEPAPHAENRHLVKVEQAVRELGNDVTVRSHNNSAKEYSGKNFYYSNKLLLRHYLIMCTSMFIVGLALFATFFYGLKLRMEYDYLLYMGAGLLPIMMSIAAIICYANNPDKLKRINVHYAAAIVIRIVIMLQVAVIIYCVNLIWGMPVSFSRGHLPALILPLAYALFIPISEVIFMYLLKSGKYNDLSAH